MSRTADDARRHACYRTRGGRRITCEQAPTTAAAPTAIPGKTAALDPSKTWSPIRQPPLTRAPGQACEKCPKTGIVSDGNVRVDNDVVADSGVRADLDRPGSYVSAPLPMVAKIRNNGGWVNQACRSPAGRIQECRQSPRPALSPIAQMYQIASPWSNALASVGVPRTGKPDTLVPWSCSFSSYESPDVPGGAQGFLTVHFAGNHVASEPMPTPAITRLRA